MSCFTVLIKIKDYYSKIGKISFDNFICIFTNNQFEGRISLMQYEYQYINHEMKNIISDINYKINVIDFTSKKLVGSCDYKISYNKINNLNIGTSINFIDKIKLSINHKSEQDLLYLTISSEIIKYNKNPSELNINQIKSLNSEHKNINKNNMLIYNHNKLNLNKNTIKQMTNRNNRKNPFEYIKIKKINTNIKNENNLNSINDSNTNYISSSRSYKRFKKSKKNNNDRNDLEIIYKREYTSPILFTEDDKKNINLNMHNICVQNYYAITSSPPQVDINPLVKKKISNSTKKKNIYTKKNLNYIKLKEKIGRGIKENNFIENTNFNKVGIKRSFTNFDLDISKYKNNKRETINSNLNENIMSHHPSNSTQNYKNKKKKEFPKKIILKKIKNKNKTKDKEKISENYLTKYRYRGKNNIDRIKSYEILNNNNYYNFLNNKKHINKNKNNYKNTIKSHSSVDKIRNNISKHNYNKITPINYRLRSSTIDNSNKKSFAKRKKPFLTNLSKYLNSLDNVNYNMTFNSSTFLKKNNYNQRHNLDKFHNYISPKSYTLRCYSNSLISKRTYNSNNNIFSKFRNYDISSDEKYHLFLEENKLYDNTINNNYIYQKNNIINENVTKNKMLNIIDNIISLKKKMNKLKNQYNYQKNKYFLSKEKYLHLIQKKNIIQQQKNINEISNYIHVNINCKINNKIIPKIKKIKEKEIIIYQNILNIFISNNDIYNQISSERIQKDNEQRLVYLFIGLLKNVIKNHGDISQIFNSNLNKKRHLLFLLINSGIEMNNINYFYSNLKKGDKLSQINNKYKCKEIKEETEEENDEEEEENDEKSLNISITYKTDNANNIDKKLIEEFPLKYNNITDKTFVKLGSNEYLFNNDIKVFAFYKDEKVFLQIENNNSIDSNDNEYSLEEFIEKYIKNINKFTKNKKYSSPATHIKNDKFFMPLKETKCKYNNFINILERNGIKRKKIKKKNLCVEKYSRNHNIINGIEINQEDFKKRFLNEKILFSNDSFINESRKSENKLESNHDEKEKEHEKEKNKIEKDISEKETNK